ncbi:MAG: EVE domain-containing protein [Pseudomonadota bacterium]
MNYWLFKTEPSDFSIQDLEGRPNKREGWDGVRNYQARNFMRDDARIGDLVLLYHSSCKIVGVAGLAKVSQINIPDPTQFDPNSKYYDGTSTENEPRWWMVEIEHVETFDEILSLKTIKTLPQINDLPLVKKGNRLSIMPVQKPEFDVILSAANAKFLAN